MTGQTYIASHRSDYYHTDPDCRKLQRGTNPRPVADSYRQPRELCTDCADAHDGPGEETEKTCDRCGETYQRLRYHLPCEG